MVCKPPAQRIAELIQPGYGNSPRLPPFRVIAGVLGNDPPHPNASRALYAPDSAGDQIPRKLLEISRCSLPHLRAMAVRSGF